MQEFHSIFGLDRSCCNAVFHQWNTKKYDDIEVVIIELYIAITISILYISCFEGCVKPRRNTLRNNGQIGPINISVN